MNLNSVGISLTLHNTYDVPFFVTPNIPLFDWIQYTSPHTCFGLIKKSKRFKMLYLLSFTINSTLCDNNSERSYNCKMHPAKQMKTMLPVGNIQIRLRKRNVICFAEATDFMHFVSVLFLLSPWKASYDSYPLYYACYLPTSLSNRSHSVAFLLDSSLLYVYSKLNNLINIAWDK